MNAEVKNLIRRIQYQAKGKHDEISPANMLRHEGNAFTFNGQVIRASRLAIVQLCTLAGVPMRVFEKLSPEQRTGSFNELFEKMGDKHFMFRFNGDQLIGVVSPNYQKIDGDILADVIKRAASSLKLVPVHSAISPEFSFVRLIPEGITGSVHELIPCMTLCNSEIGLSAFRIMAGVYRRSYNSGLIVEEKQRNWRWLHYGSNVEVKPDFKEVMFISNLYVRYLDKTKGRYLNVEEKVEFANIVKRALGVKVTDAFIDTANSCHSGGRDWFCVINALGQTAIMFPPIKAVEIQLYAGRTLAHREAGLN